MIKFLSEIWSGLSLRVERQSNRKESLSSHEPGDPAHIDHALLIVCTFVCTDFFCQERTRRIIKAKDFVYTFVEDDVSASNSRNSSGHPSRQHRRVCTISI